MNIYIYILCPLLVHICFPTNSIWSKQHFYKLYIRQSIPASCPFVHVFSPHIPWIQAFMSNSSPVHDNMLKCDGKLLRPKYDDFSALGRVNLQLRMLSFVIIHSKIYQLNMVCIYRIYLNDPQLRFQNIK